MLPSLPLTTAIRVGTPGPVTSTVSSTPSPLKSPVAVRTSPAKGVNTPPPTTRAGGLEYAPAALGV